MGNQHETSNHAVDGDRQSSNAKSQYLESPFAKLQRVLGNRTGGDHFKASLDRYHQTQGKAASHPLDPLMSSVGVARPTQDKPLFRGLSHELQADTASSGMIVQAKMAVRPAGDRYEQEADRVARQAVQQIHSAQTSSSTQLNGIQSSAQTEALRLETLHPKAIQSGVSAEGGVAVTPELETSIGHAKSGGRPLTDPLRESMEQALGANFSGVRIHVDRRSDHLNRSISAQAFTNGQDIFFRQGAYTPQSHQGQSLIAHELAHVVQQNEGIQEQGRLQPQKNIASEVRVNEVADQISLRNSNYPGSVVQLERLPADSTGDITRVMAKTKEKEITGTELQAWILAEAKKTADEYPITEEGSGNILGRVGGYRLGTYEYIKGESLKRVKDPKPEPHGMPMYPAEKVNPKMDNIIEIFVLSTMSDAGQVNYINKNWDTISKTHTVVVDVDCQFDRRGQVGFHKDSRGRTVFVNLTYTNEKEMQGPEYYEDLEGVKLLEEKLPDEVREDIKTRREKKRDEEGIHTIETNRLKPHGRISFLDPSIWHSTPLMKHRGLLEPRWPVNKEDAIEMLRKEVSADYPWETLTDEVLVGYLANDLYPARPTELSGHGIAEELKLPEEIRERKVKEEAARPRRLSIDLAEKKLTPDKLTEEEQTPRTFVRSWVRMIPKAELS